MHVADRRCSASFVGQTTHKTVPFVRKYKDCFVIHINAKSVLIFSDRGDSFDGPRSRVQRALLRNKQTTLTRCYIWSSWFRRPTKHQTPPQQQPPPPPPPQTSPSKGYIVKHHLARGQSVQLETTQKRADEPPENLVLRSPAFPHQAGGASLRKSSSL